jgi:hypothetical protein
MDELHRALQVAWDDSSVTAMIDVLIEIAETEIMHEKMECAADILALVIHYPMPIEMRERAEGMLSDLEIMVCPRVMWDAREKALMMTLDDMIAQRLASAE